MVVKAPTASSTHPAPFRVSLLSFPAISKPNPAPSAARVPAMRMISGIVKLFSHINASAKTTIMLGCSEAMCQGLVVSRNFRTFYLRTLGLLVRYQKYAAVTMPITQTGYDYDSAVYYRARYYDPAIVLSELPVGFRASAKAH